MFTATAFSSQDIVRDGLVLWLDANDKTSYPGSGTVWRDLSLGGNNGTLTNGPTFDSANGGSIVFDGVNDYVIFPNLNPGNSITIDVWFKKNTGTSWQGILGNWNSTGTGDSWLITQSSQNRISFYIRFSGGGGDSISDNTTTILSDVWYNYTGTFSNSLLSIYKNGLLVNSKPTTQNTIFQNALNVWVGRFSSYYYNGIIPIGRVYNRALTPQEILQNYNATKDRYL